MPCTHNLTVKQSRLSAQTADVALLQSRAAMLPSANLNGTQNWNYGTSVNPLTNVFQNQTTRTNNFSAASQLTLFSGFQLRNTVKRNELDYEAALSDIEKARNDLVAERGLGVPADRAGPGAAAYQPGARQQHPAPGGAHPEAAQGRGRGRKQPARHPGPVLHRPAQRDYGPEPAYAGPAAAGPVPEPRRGRLRNLGHRYARATRPRRTVPGRPEPGPGVRNGPDPPARN